MITVSENIKNITPYTPGKPVEELERELGISGSIKLASNENPLGPSPKALRAIREGLSGLNRYPDGSGYYLRQAIAQKQGIAFKLADMHIETEASRWMVWKAASQLEQGLDATRSAHFARSYAAEKSMWIADEGVQVLGGHGFIRDHPVEMWFRNARTLGVLEGTVAV